MPSTLSTAQRDGIAQLERRKGLLGRSNVGALAATYTLVAIAVGLTAVLFAAVANLASGREAGPPNVTAVPQGPEGLQVIHADPLEKSQLLAYLSVPGRLGVNAPAATGMALSSDGVPLAAAGRLQAGDTLRICTLVPVPSVQLTLVDSASGAAVGSHLFLDPPVCPSPAGGLPL